MMLQHHRAWFVVLMLFLFSGAGMAQRLPVDVEMDEFLRLERESSSDRTNYETFKKLSAQGQIYTEALKDAFFRGELDSYQFTLRSIYTFRDLGEGFARFGMEKFAFQCNDLALAYARDTQWEPYMLYSRYRIYRDLGKREESLLCLMEMADSPHIGTGDARGNNITNILFLAEKLVRDSRKAEAFDYYERFFDVATELRFFGRPEIMPDWKRFKKLAKELGMKIKRKDYFDKQVKDSDTKGYDYFKRTPEEKILDKQEHLRRLERETMIFDENREAFSRNGGKLEDMDP